MVRKSSLMDVTSISIFIIVGLIFIFAIASAFNIAEEVFNNSFEGDNTTKDVLKTGMDGFFKWMDSLFFFFIIGSLLLSLLFALFLNYNLFSIPLSIIFYIIALLIWGVLQIILRSLALDYNDVLYRLPLISILVKYYLVIFVIFGALMILFMYINPQRREEV